MVALRRSDGKVAYAVRRMSDGGPPGVKTNGPRHPSELGGSFGLGSAPARSRNAGDARDLRDPATRFAIDKPTTADRHRGGILGGTMAWVPTERTADVERGHMATAAYL